MATPAAAPKAKGCPGPPRCATIVKKPSPPPTTTDIPTASPKTAKIAAAAAAATSRGQTSAKVDSSLHETISLEFRSTHIDPIAHIDTNDSWFGNKSGAKGARQEGREWIQAFESAMKRRQEYEEFDVESLLHPAGPSSIDELDVDEIRQQRRTAKARDMEERHWAARHKPKSSGMTMSSTTWKGPSRGHDVHDSLSTSQAHYVGSDDGATNSDMDAGTRLRERALWLPVGESHTARSSRPGPDWCGAVLFQGAPGSIVPDTRGQGLVAPSEDVAQPEVARPPSPSRKSIRMNETPLPKDPNCKALGLWNTLSGVASPFRHRPRGARSRERTNEAAMQKRGAVFRPSTIGLVDRAQLDYILKKSTIADRFC